MKQKISILIAWLLVFLGIIGIIIPILPTTPFLLISAYLFSKNSPKFHHWIINHKILGEYIRSYQNGEGIPLKIKIRTIMLLWLAIGTSIYFVRQTPWLIALLILIACMVSLHIILIRKK